MYNTKTCSNKPIQYITVCEGLFIIVSPKLSLVSPLLNLNHHEDILSFLNGSFLEPLLVLVASLLAPVAVSLAALAAASTVPQAAPANSFVSFGESPAGTVCQ